MCLLIFAYNCHPGYRLIMAANRDEYFKRPTEHAHFWDSHPWVLAGRDLEMFGTWMGITRSGRFAALTNFRDPTAQIVNAQSRGKLVSNFLCSYKSLDEYLQEVQLNSDQYNPFNLLVGDRLKLMYYSKQSSSARELSPGIYGLSNHYLDFPWPKVQKSKQALANYLKNELVIDTNVLINMLADEEPAQDRDLPETGIGYEFEKLLSSIFIRSTYYGTRSSTVLLIDRSNRVTFKEKSFHQGQQQAMEVEHKFVLSED